MENKQADRIYKAQGPGALLAALGEVAPPYRNPNPTTRIIDDKVTMLCACNKVVNVMEMPRRHSGVVQYVDNVCVGCEDRAKGLCPVVCCRCHRVAGRMPPTKDKWGFKVEAGRTYHIEKCPICSPDECKVAATPEGGKVAAVTPIIEMQLFHASVGVKS